MSNHDTYKQKYPTCPNCGEQVIFSHEFVGDGDHIQCRMCKTRYVVKTTTLYTTREEGGGDEDA